MLVLVFAQPSAVLCLCIRYVEYELYIPPGFMWSPRYVRPHQTVEPATSPALSHLFFLLFLMYVLLQ
jgi:hypothetical protein